jgi:O-antigen/teichoic acid export membrane protein
VAATWAQPRQAPLGKRPGCPKRLCNVQLRLLSIPQLLLNAAGTWWPAAVQLAAVPLYVALLGVESYAIIALYVLMLIVVKVFDLGIGVTVNRVLARDSVGVSVLPEETAMLARTFELTYWGIGFVLAAALLAASPWASTWIDAPEMVPQGLQTVVRLMAVGLFLTWPASFYQNALLGLGRTARANVAAATAASVAALASLLALVAFDRRLDAFFACQIAVAASHVVYLRHALSRALPRPPRGSRPWRVSTQRLRGVITGAGVLSVLGILLSHVDRVVLSRLATLEEFGYYMLGATVASGVAVVSAPVFASAYPRLSQMAGTPGAAIDGAYSQAFVTMLALVVPVGFTIAGFPFDVLLLWTGDATIATAAAPTTRALCLGASALGIALIPAALQLAFGETRQLNVLAAVTVALMAALTAVFGAAYTSAAVAVTWCTLAWAYCATAMSIAHRRMTEERTAARLVRHLVVICAASALTTFAVSLLVAAPTSRVGAVVRLGMGASAALAAGLVVLRAPASLRRARS